MIIFNFEALFVILLHVFATQAIDFDADMYPTTMLVQDNKHVPNGLFIAQMKQYTYFSLTARNDWNVVRLIWIAYYKNELNDKCHFDQLPKDIVICIVNLLRTSLWANILE